MLQKHNVGYASTCNAVGQTAGYFMGYVFFMALESYGLVTLPGFLQFWAVVFLITTTLVAVLKSENGTGEGEQEEEDIGVVRTYKLLLDILKLSVMPATIALLLTSKLGFAAADAVTGLKLVEAGVPKDKLAMIAIPMMPLQIVLPWIISRYTAGPRPLDVWARALPARLVLCLVMAGLVWVTPSFQLPDSSFPLHYYGIVIFVYGIYQVVLYSMFVSVMAFFAKVISGPHHRNLMSLTMTVFFPQVSDPAVGGTYMTLLNTLTNLGGNWPSTLALWCVDPLTVKECQGALANSTVSALANSCSSPEDTAQCTESGGVCATQVTSRNLSSSNCD